MSTRVIVRLVLIITVEEYSLLSMLVYSLQAAQRGMESALKQLSSAGDEQSKAEAQVAVDFHEALLQSVKA